MPAISFSNPIDVKEVQPLKALLPIFTKLSGMFIDVKFAQFSNAEFPIDFIELGNVIFLMLLFSKKALSPIAITRSPLYKFGIVTSAIAPSKPVTTYEPLSLVN